MTRRVDGYALGTFSDGSGEFAGLVSGDRVLPLEAATVRDLLDDWESVRTRLPDLAAGLADGGGRPLAELTVKPPVMPRQIFQAGANYRSHVAEIVLSGREPDDTRSDEELRREAETMMDEKARTGSPFFFAGLPAAICGPDDDVLLPAESAKVDWEVELTAVIGKTAHRVPRERAMEHVAGFTVCNDISARDLQFPPEHRPLGGDWIRAKNRPTFLPTGPFIVPVEVLPDYRELEITLDLNGERKQSDVPANLLFDVEAIIAAASTATTLHPGDLVLTGSPAGNGGKWQRWLGPGDVMEAGISGIGVQRNTCVQEPR
ncbi:fumarylacetoacetate hydrolase family protein [Saccharopolyspora flava]|uniref:2-keto-4-pentenoate hydratase/2-oxohepta-3-ene-1,7-dioic acid hydratase (Catechol pathway) n=1 Tax=Saccharopolyspora flava TaxID=95161 RepID=A0A1I6V473_9PSEU|nr:fumarylacetoacetate hydrolase family protein [Saccharopolyspora flava]SFT08444.1 2-keto-4-pentenoate hydratase/2-oxohepta-3-ene-1,7-dioic acid hydratase (catechol pathway) [Saccharopolyspora flava]